MARPHAAFEAAVYTLLADHITGAAVYQDVPDNYSGSTVTLADLDGEPLDAKDSTDWSLRLSVLSEVAAEERAPCIALMDQVFNLLHRARIIVPGWVFAITFEADNVALDEGGASYVGTSFFRAIALSSN